MWMGLVGWRGMSGRTPPDTRPLLSSAREFEDLIALLNGGGIPEHLRGPAAVLATLRRLPPPPGPDAARAFPPSATMEQWKEGANAMLRLSSGVSLRDEIFFFLLRTALKDRPKGPPTANRQLPSTANRHQPPTTKCHQPPPTASGDQPPTANHCQLPPTTNRQPPTAANHHQPPPTASCQLPTANRRQPPTANCHQPWLSTSSARGLFWETGTLFFFPLRTPLPELHRRGLPRGAPP